MPNLALGQTTWNRLGREMGLFCGQLKELRDFQRKYNRKRSRIQVRDNQEGFAITTEWTLAGVRIGTNTDEEGRLFVRIADETPGAGQARVSVYKATGGGGGDLVAEGEGANGATITLSEENDSGLTGTVKLGTVTANETNDQHRLRVYPDWFLRAAVVWDGSATQDPDSRDFFEDATELAEASINNAIANVENGFRSWLGSRFADVMLSGKSSPISFTQTDDTGAIETNYLGILEDGRRNMADEGTPAEQFVVKNAITPGAGVFDALNQGVGTMAAPTFDEWAGPGLYTFTCVSSVIGAEQFQVTFKEAVSGITRTALKRLQVKKTFSDPILAIRGALLERTIAFDTADAADFATAADYSIEGETSGNTSDGTLYMKVVAGTANPALFKIQFFKASTYSYPDSFVAETEEGAANAIVAILQKRGSGLTGVGKIGTAPVAGGTRELRLQTFRTLNTNGFADQFTVTVTVASRGEFQDRIAEAFRYQLNSATSGSETLHEGYVRAGTFPPYAVRDV